MVDVFSIVRKIRQQRRGMIQTTDQYRFCYEAVAQSLSSEDGSPVREPAAEREEPKQARPFSEPPPSEDTPRTKRKKLYLQHNLPPPPSYPPPDAPTQEDEKKARTTSFPVSPPATTFSSPPPPSSSPPPPLTPLPLPEVMVTPPPAQLEESDLQLIERKLMSLALEAPTAAKPPETSSSPETGSQESLVKSPDIDTGSPMKSSETGTSSPSVKSPETSSPVGASSPSVKSPEISSPIKSPDSSLIKSIGAALNNDEKTETQTTSEDNAMEFEECASEKVIPKPTSKERDVPRKKPPVPEKTSPVRNIGKTGVIKRPRSERPSIPFKGVLPDTGQANQPGSNVDPKKDMQMVASQEEKPDEEVFQGFEVPDFSSEDGFAMSGKPSPLTRKTKPKWKPTAPTSLAKQPWKVSPKPEEQGHKRAPDAVAAKTPDMVPVVPNMVATEHEDASPKPVGKLVIPSIFRREKQSPEKTKEEALGTESKGASEQSKQQVEPAAKEETKKPEADVPQVLKMIGHLKQKTAESSGNAPRSPVKSLIPKVSPTPETKASWLPQQSPSRSHTAPPHRLGDSSRTVRQPFISTSPPPTTAPSTPAHITPSAHTPSSSSNSNSTSPALGTVSKLKAMFSGER